MRLAVVRAEEPAGSLGAAFAAIADARPDAIALIAGARRVTYGELAGMTARIACGLAARGLGRGDRVGLALPRSIEQVAAMLAVFRIGAVLVPLDAAWRDGIVVAHAIDQVEEVAGTPPAVVDDPDALALALYTSGSTGIPKAVLLDHRALTWRLHALALAMPYRADDLACHRTPATFIDAYAEILGPLLAGVPAIVLPHPLAIADLAAAIESAGVTRLLLVPSLLALLLDARPALPASLRLVATSGEALTDALAARFFAASRAQLANIYGSTEVAGDATIALLAPGEPVTIGRPLEGVTLRIVDDELQIAGPILARGYADQPALTAARFVDGWFRTGDRARRLADGRYALAGRVDDQVKIHGVRVELGEVEAALRALHGVREAGAAVHDGRLVAGVVGDNIDLAALRLRVMPSAIAILPALPTTHHGKRDRAALAAQVIAATARTPAAAADPRVAQLCGWFTQLAGAPAGPDDELAALGGDSLARLGLLVELERAGWHLDHADLPVPLTPARLAAVLPARTVATAAIDDGTPFAVTDFQRVMVLESLANRGTPLWLDQVAYTIHAPVDAARFADAWRAEIAAQPALRTRFVVDRDVRQVVVPAVPFALAHVPLRALALAAYRQRVKAEEWTRISRAFDLAAAPLFEVCLLEGADRCDLIFTYHHAILDGESARRVLRDVLARYAGQPVAVAPETFRSVCERPVASPDALRARLAGHVAAALAPTPRATGMGDLAWRLFHRLLAIRAWLAAWRVRRRSKRLPLTHAPSVYAGGDITSQPLPQVLDAAVARWSRAQRTTPVAAWATAFALHLARERSASGARSTPEGACGSIERATTDVVFGVVVAGRDGRSAETIGMLANCLPLRVQLDPRASIARTVAAVTAALAELDAHGRAPMLDLGVDPRAMLDTLLTVWRFPLAAPPALPLSSGRGLTMTAPHTALIVTPSELAVGANAFHRTDRIRRELLALVDALLAAAPDAPLAELLAIAPHEGGLSVAQPAL